MALNTTALANTWRKLVEFTLDSATIRYSDTDIALSNNTLYSGRVINISELRRSIGRLLDPKLQQPQMRVDLDNEDDSVRTTLDKYEFANRPVTIKLGQGNNASDYDDIFTGIVKFPGGIEWNDKSASIRISDLVESQSRVLPVNKFFTSTYSNVEAKSQNLPIPLVYGDWKTTAGNGETVPCYCDNTTTGTGGHFTIADHVIDSIEAVYKDGSSVAYTADLANGGFTLNVSYDPLINTITANCTGAEDSGGTLIQTLPDILEDILTTYLGASAGQIDSTAFSDWEGNLSASDYGRRVISTELSSNTLISELLVDGFADLTVEGGKYTPVYRIVEISSGLTTYRENDILNKTDSSKEFRVVRDEEKVYANQIVAEYAFDPVNVKFSDRYDTQDTGAINTVNQRRRRRLQLQWLYIQTGAEDRADRELFVFSTEVETVFVTLQGGAVTLAPSDQFRLIYSKFGTDGTGTPFQVREILVNPLKMTARIKAWNMLNLSSGRWTADSATTWLLSTATERNDQGHWTDASGYADPTGTPDEASKRSKWF